jgi:transcriptional regulator with XRE-family HTH domain
MPTRKPKAPPAPPPAVDADTPPDLSTLGGRLKHARLLRGMKVKPLSLAAGLSTSAEFQIEANPTRDVRVGTVLALAEQLEVHPAWLAFGVGAMGHFPPELRAPPPARKR